jgi:hypothetical protein
MAHLLRYKERMAMALAEVPMTRVRDDPYVHFGDVLQLLHANTNSVLSVDVEAKVKQGPTWMIGSSSLSQHLLIG